MSKTMEQLYEKMYHDLQKENLQLRLDLDEARQHAARWEVEAKSLRRELSFLRMSADTERIRRER